METLSCREIKDKMSEVLNRVAYKKERYKIARHNKDVAIIISIDEWSEIEKLLKKIEDEDDLAEAREALKEAKAHGSVSLEEMKKRTAS